MCDSSINGQLRLDLSPDFARFAIHVTLTPRQTALLEELMHFEDPQERLSAVVDRARHRPQLPADLRNAGHRVAGCSSNVWLAPRCDHGRCTFAVGADSPVVLGLVTLLADFYADSTPAEILASNVDPLEGLHLSRTLSATRRHGLAAVSAAIRQFAQSQLSPPPAA